MRGILAIGFVGLQTLLVACASYQSKVFESRNLLKTGRVSEATEKLKILAEKESDDQLVHLLDYGTALQISGNYKESNEALLKADKLIDLNDYHSVSNIAAATLGSESMIQYKGESYEKFLVNAFISINFLMLNQTESALVEVRRINEKLTKMKMDGRKPYELNPFAKYLSALIWESDQKFDDAYIAFEQAYNLDPMNPFIASDLIRAAKNAKRTEAYRKHKSEFNDIKEADSWYDKSLGELVVIFQQGWGPEKHVTPGQYRLPSLYPVMSRTQSLQVAVGNQTVHSKTIYNIEQVAIQTLKDDYSALVARRTGGIAAKAVFADQIRQKNELLGQVAWIAMNISDQADLRQWSTLPETIQLIRLPLAAGKHKVKIQELDAQGNPVTDFFEVDVNINARRKTFYNYRALK